MSITLGVVALLISLLCVLVGGLEAYRDRFFNLEQMRDHYARQGLPWMYHLGMIGNVFIVSPLVGLWVGHYGMAWSPTRYILAVVIGIVVSAVSHWFWAYSNNMYESHLELRMVNNEPVVILSPAGKVNALHMSYVVAALALFYVWTPDANPQLMLASSIALTIYLVMGNHIVWGIIRPAWFPLDQKPHKSIVSWGLVIGPASLFFWRTWWIWQHNVR